LLLKLLLVVAWSRCLGASSGTALRSGLWLCAGGEFGFVLLADVSQQALLSPLMLQSVLAALVLSLSFAPLIVHFSDRLVLRLVASEWMLRSMALTQIATQVMRTERHAIICGFGRCGQYLARFLAEEGIAYVALDLDPERVREASAAGETVFYGDAARHELLLAAGVKRASVLVISFANTRAAERILHQVHEIRPDLPVVVRTIDEKDFERLHRAGAAEVVPEKLEASMMLASQTLMHVGVPINRVFRRMRQMRMARYRSLRGFFRGESDRGESKGEEAQENNELRLRSVSLSPEAYAVGRVLGELSSAQLNVEVMAVRRRNIRALEPSAGIRFEAADVVVLRGSAAALALFEARLLKG
ncbi:MAG: NAD-binding protein, partial [Pseudomonadota bacterium]